MKPPILITTISLMIASSCPNLAQSAAPKTVKLSDSEEKALKNCLEIIRGCQLEDGAFNMVDHGKTADSNVWIAPYFANHSAIALLAAHERKKNTDDVDRVGKWLDWNVKRQEKGGFWYDYVGTVVSYKTNSKVDAHDSSAALFLTVVERYRRAGGKITQKLEAAVKSSIGCIANVTDKDGLTWAKPDYQVKYLMDNIEVYAGLVSAEEFWTARGDKELAREMGTKSKALGAKLKDFWAAKEKERFAWVLHPNGKFESGMDKLYPQGLAQLFGIAFVRGESDPFQEVAKKFEPQNSPEGTGPERYLIAAARLGDKATVDKWRAATAKAAAKFNATNVYIYRPGLAALGLLEGADWMPSLLAPMKK